MHNRPNSNPQPNPDDDLTPEQQADNKANTSQGQHQGSGQATPPTQAQSQDWAQLQPQDQTTWGQAPAPEQNWEQPEPSNQTWDQPEPQDQTWDQPEPQDREQPETSEPEKPNIDQSLGRGALDTFASQESAPTPDSQPDQNYDSTPDSQSNQDSQPEPSRPDDSIGATAETLSGPNQYESLPNFDSDFPVIPEFKRLQTIEDVYNRIGQNPAASNLIEKASVASVAAIAASSLSSAPRLIDNPHITPLNATPAAPANAAFPSNTDPNFSDGTQGYKPNLPREQGTQNLEDAIATNSAERSEPPAGSAPANETAN